MAYWQPFADWMAFSHLDGSNGQLACAYTIGYRITDDSGDRWTNRFNRFKVKDQSALWGGYSVLWDAVPQLVKAMGLQTASTVFVAALSSGETHASPDGVMPRIAAKCAERVGARFALNALSKQVHNPIHNIYNAADRNAELDKAAYVASPVGARSILVFDDLITRGDTLSRIAQAFSEVEKHAQIFGVALAKTERRSWNSGTSNDHVPQKWEDAWSDGEARYKNRNRG